MATSDVSASPSDVAKFILSPTDFSAESDLAFAHALRLAIANQARLTFLHVGQGNAEEWDQFPEVRRTLERWGMLDPGSRRSDVAKLGVQVAKLAVRADDVVDAIAKYSLAHQVDLLVLATEQRTGLDAWLMPSVAGQTARKMGVPTLFVPAAGRTCVSIEDGSVAMDQVLIPVDHTPPVGGAIERGMRAIRAFGSDRSRLTLLHVGQEFPDVRLPGGSAPIDRMLRQGSPVKEILRAAEEISANLIVMVTNGAEGFWDSLRGTTTEQVIRNAPCPVLSVPADF